MSNSQSLLFGRDAQGYNAYAPIPATVIYSATLVNGSPQSINVPQDYSAWIVAFSYQPGTILWVDFTGSTAAVPAGATFVATTSELLPGARYVYSKYNDATIASISLITSNASADVSVAFYAIR